VKPMTVRSTPLRPRCAFKVWIAAALWLTLPPSGTALNVQDFDALAQAATKAREGGRLLESAEAYRKALDVRPDWAEGWWYLGTVLYDLDRYSEAAVAFDHLLKLVPIHGPARAMKGLCEFRLGEHERALSGLIEARLMGLGDNQSLVSVVRYHLGILLTRHQRFEEALEVLKEFAKRNVRNLSVVEAFGLAALRMPVLPVEAPPERREAVLLAGGAAYECARDSFAACEAMFRQLVSRCPNDAAARYAFGYALSNVRGRQGLGQAEAMTLFKEAIELDPTYVEAYLQLASTCLAAGDYACARQYAAQARQMNPDSFAARHLLGRSILEDGGDVNDAVRELEAAVRQAPDIPQVRWALARAYRKAGMAAAAEREAQEFKRLQEMREEWIRKVLR
jgi:tetratricopeptide (TPR) repeat protein